MQDTKLQTLKEMMTLLNKQTISPEQLAQFLKAVIDSIQKTKVSLADENKEKTKELKARLEQSLNVLEEGQISLKTALQGTVDGRIGILTKNTENTLEKAQQALAEIKKIEINKPLDGIDGVDGSPDTRKEIIEKINKGNGLKIKANQIEGHNKFLTQVNLDRAIAILDQRSQYLINKKVKVDGVTITGNGTDDSPFAAPGGAGGGSVLFVDNELVGTGNDVTTVFNIANTPIAGSVKVYVGLRQRLTTDYSISGTAITFVIAPPSGQPIISDYRR